MNDESEIFDQAEAIDFAVETIMNIRSRIEYECESREKNDPDYKTMYCAEDKRHLTALAYREYNELCVRGI